MNDVSAFIPHAMGFAWRPDAVAFRRSCDSLIALSSFCVLVLLLTFGRNRPSPRRFGWFLCAFIVSSSLVQVMDVWMIWHPDDRTMAAFEAAAAMASLGSVGALLQLIPFARARLRLSDGIWLTDSVARTTHVNARLAEMLGFSVAEMNGAPIFAFFMDEKSGAAARAWFAASRSTEDVNPFIFCLRRKDGSPLWIEMSAKPIHDAHANVVGGVGTISDATEPRRARLALALSDRQYRTIVEAMAQIVYTVTPEGPVDYCNRAWYLYTDLSEEQTYAGGWNSVLHADDEQRFLSAWSRARRNGQPLEIETRLRRASDGLYRWFNVHATPIHDANGAIAKWIGSCADIHDYKVASDNHSILDTIGNIISIRNDDGSFEYVSPSWAQYTGTADNLGAADRRKSIHPDDLEALDRQDRACHESEPATQQSEIRVRAADGGYRWFLARTVALAAAAGMSKRRLNTLTDIDDLKRTQAAFGYSETCYRALTDALPQIVWIIDEQTNVEYVNERWSSYTGLAFEPDLPSKTASILHPDDLVVLAAAQDALREQRDFECELRMRRRDGVYRWHLVRAVPLGNVALSGTRWIVTATDIEARKTAEAALVQSAAELTHRDDYDPLTNLPNRTKLTDRLAQLIAEAQRDGTDVVVLYVDIDHFKMINDTLGHDGGDTLLVEIAMRMSSTLRADDMASRFGGDEFVLVCAAAGGDEAPRIAERIQAALHAPIELDGKRVVVASSIGISVFPHDGFAPTDLIKKADSAMCAAKENGRNTWCRYSIQTHPPTPPALEFEAEIREAIALKQFVVYYQPIIDIRSGRPIAAEALVRWAHPQRGMLPPDEFVPFAENHGLIAPIGEFVLDAACAQLQCLNLRTSDNFSLAVNVSAHQFRKPGFVETIGSAIASHGLDARRLEIEITESVVMGDTAAAIATLDRLRGLGVKLAIDDFGTGYSSLAYLKNFPIHTLKIDRSFVFDIALNPTDQAIAKTIVTLAHSLGMRVIAEGVETADQLEQLRLFGADCFQGFLVSRPLSSADFEDFLADCRSIANRIA